MRAGPEEEDKARRDAIEKRNRADQLCYTVEKTLDEAKDKIDEAKVKRIKDEVASLRSAIEKQDDAAITSGTETLEKLMHEIAASAYAGAEGGAPGAEAAPGAAPPKDKKGDDVIDAEFEEGN